MTELTGSGKSPRVPGLAPRPTKHDHRRCPQCAADGRAGCICPEQQPEIRWTDCPVHGDDRLRHHLAAAEHHIKVVEAENERLRALVEDAFREDTGLSVWHDPVYANLVTRAREAFET